MSNTTDKRSVSTDALETLGKIHTRQEYRDAIHLAVEPVEAGENLFPGTHVYIKDGKAFNVGFSQTDALRAVGIVDPFISVKVEQGQRFWLVIYPRMITSLRHVWSHPAFEETESQPIEPLKFVHIPLLDDEQLRDVKELQSETLEEGRQRTQEIKAALHATDKKEKAKASAYEWIEQYASRLGDDISAEELISYGKDYLDCEMNGGWPDYLVKGGTLEGESTCDVFWQKLAIYLDMEIADDFSGNFFSCSC